MDPTLIVSEVPDVFNRWKPRGGTLYAKTDADPASVRISSGVPSGFLKRTSPLIGFSVVFTRTSCEFHPPPSANCGMVIACVVVLFAFATGVGLMMESVFSFVKTRKIGRASCREGGE